MINGICITLGIIIVIASRFLYGHYDITLGGDSENNAYGTFAVITDVLGTALIVYSLLSHNGYL